MEETDDLISLEEMPDYDLCEYTLVRDGDSDKWFLRKEPDDVIAYRKGLFRVANIDELKAKLSDTDYIGSKMLDQLMACDSLAGLLGVLKSFKEEYAKVIAEREQWREKIRELEGEDAVTAD